MREARAAFRASRQPEKKSLNPFKRKAHPVEVHEAFVDLFFVDGRLRPSAQIVLDDLAEAAGVGMAAAGLEHEELCVLEGKRRLWLHVMARFQMDQDKIDAFYQQMRKDFP
jgi:hypothetical protein